MRKLFAVLLSMMLLITPVLGSAATPSELLDLAWQAGRAQNVTVSLRLNEEILELAGEEDLMLAGEVLNVASVSVVTAQEGPWKAALNLSGNEVLNVIGESGEELSYLGSTLLGDDVLAASEAEKMIIANYLIEMMAQEDIISSSDAAQFKMLVMMAPALMEEMAASAEAVNPENINTEPLDTLFAEWDARMTPVAEPVQPDGCDFVAEAYTITLTGDDLLALHDAAFEVLMAVPSFAQGFAQGAGVEDPEAMLAQMKAEMQQALAENPVEIPVTVMTDPFGEIVCVLVTMNMTNVTASINDAEMSMQQAPVTVRYQRQTVENGKKHVFNMTAQEDEESFVALLEIDVENVLAQRVTFTMAMVDGEELENSAVVEWTSDKEQTDTTASEDGSFVFSVSEYEDGVETGNSIHIDYTVDAAYDGKDAACNTEIILTVDGQRIGTLLIETESCDPVPTLANGEIVRIGQLISQSDPEDASSPLNQYLATLQEPVMLNLIGIVQNLPVSLMMQMMEIMQ